jgi:ring-1,2-phenylacetyl-CoA epoxidase subunit PaaE
VAGGQPATEPAGAKPARPGRPGRGQFHELAVARVDRLCDDAVAVTFDVPPGLAELFRFQPGQSLTLRRMADGREERRSYSICSAAGEPPRIGVREVPGGAVSGWLVRDVRPGDRIEAQPPSGSFTPDLAAGGRHVLIAAGSGITPILSIAASALRQPGTEATLLYGNRRADSVMFADEVADLKDAHPARLQLAHVLSREPQEVELFTGRMDAAKLRLLLPAVCAVGRVDHWWLCGPFGMVTDAMDVLAELGVPGDRIHRELFYVEDEPPAQEHHEEPALAGGSEVTVILDGRTTTTTIPRGTPVLDGAQRARPDLPFACKGGVCGTCRARLRAGEVRMRRNFALEQAEVDAGYVLTCQSLPVSDELTVDYDA